MVRSSVGADFTVLDFIENNTSGYYFYFLFI
jgi:hypothetical protein